METSKNKCDLHLASITGGKFLTALEELCPIDLQGLLDNNYFFLGRRIMIEEALIRKNEALSLKQ